MYYVTVIKKHYHKFVKLKIVVSLGHESLFHVTDHYKLSQVMPVAITCYIKMSQGWSICLREWKIVIFFKMFKSSK